jgi:hypothetical protein
MQSLPPLRRLVRPLAAGLLSACAFATDPSPAAVAGVYRLEVVNGRAVPDTAAGASAYAPYAGMIALRANGEAERSVTYRDSRGALVPTAAVGSFEVRGDAVQLALRESPAYVWRVRGELAGGVLTLHYPNPADGEIVERYRRQ